MKDIKNPTNSKISPNMVERYVYLTELRDAAALGSENEGSLERANAQSAIDRMCEKMGFTEKDLKVAVDAMGVAAEFHVGKDEPHIASFKASLLKVVADGHAIEVQAFAHGMSFVLIGPKGRVRDAQDLYRYLLVELEDQGAKAFAKRVVKFDDGADERKLSWIHSFRQGAAMSIKERLAGRNLQRMREEAEVNGFSEAVQREAEAKAMAEIMKDVLASDEMLDIMKEIVAKEERAKAEKIEADRARLTELGITHNSLGYVAGRQMGKVIPLQVAVQA